MDNAIDRSGFCITIRNSYSKSVFIFTDLNKMNRFIERYYKDAQYVGDRDTHYGRLYEAPYGETIETSLAQVPDALALTGATDEMVWGTYVNGEFRIVRP